MFIIRDPATGATMPVGGSKAEPSLTKAPRLFRRRCDAANALACWEAGRWHCYYDSEGEPEGPMPRDSRSNMKLSEERKARGLEVFEVRLTVA